jgi:hypothetical protein
MNLQDPSAQGRAAVQVARELLTSIGAIVPQGYVEDLKRSPFPEVQTLLSWIVFERPGSIEGFRDRWQAALQLCFDFLLACVERNYRDNDVLTRYESAECILILFLRLWNLKSEDAAREVRDGLATTCRTAPDRQQVDVIVTGVLEHAFTNHEVATFFANWKSDPRLATTYDESFALAQSLRAFRESPAGAALKGEVDRLHSLSPGEREAAIIEQAQTMLNRSQDGRGLN